MAAALSAGAAQIWNGPFITFTKETMTDWTEPANQDHITPDVWLTRATSQGLFNAASETYYTHYLSPTNTEWAYGQLTDYASLSYTNWEGWNGRHPPSMVGEDAVLHLISDDIYLAIRFLSWDVSGGGFSYERSTAPLGFQTVTTSDDMITFTWNAIIGQSYEVEYTVDLTPPIFWWPIDSPITATDSVATEIDWLSLDERRFYRVVQVP